MVSLPLVACITYWLLSVLDTTRVACLYNPVRDFIGLLEYTGLLGVQTGYPEGDLYVTDASLYTGGLNNILAAQHHLTGLLEGDLCPSDASLYTGNYEVRCLTVTHWLWPFRPQRE